MKHIDIKSRLIRSVYYDESGGQLQLFFEGGGERRFRGVPEAAVVALVEAASPGQHYVDSIRRKYERIT
jgi:hypothetical protein